MPSNTNVNVDNHDDDYEYDHYCVDCEDGIDDDDAYYCEADGEYRCRSCEREYQSSLRDRLILDYSTKLEPFFGHDDGAQSFYVRKSEHNSAVTPLYMGFELETEANDGYRDQGAKHVLLVTNSGNHIGNGRVYLKHDSSLDDGFEIVSHPATLGFFMNHFPWDGISQLRRMGFHAWKARTCGLHIHLSRSAFTDDKHLTVFIKFLYDNRNELIQFAGRNSENYASWDKLKFTNGYNDWSTDAVVSESLPKFIKNGRYNTERMTAVNLRNRDTIELRFFRPSLRPETVQAALMMCDAIHQYSGILTFGDMTLRNALSYRSFRSWLDTQGDKYKLLADRIDARNDI